MGLTRITALLLCQAALLAGAPQRGLTITVSILDQANQAVPGVHVQLKSAQEVVSATDTNQQGYAEFIQLKHAHYELTATKTGFEPIRRDIDLSQGESAAIELTVVPTLGRKEN